MPQIFKVLVSIAVWILFVYGCLGVIGGLVVCGMRVHGVAALVHPLVGIASLILSCVAAWLRKKLE
jgi:hypothetical protein